MKDSKRKRRIQKMEHMCRVYVWKASREDERGEMGCSGWCSILVPDLFFFSLKKLGVIKICLVVRDVYTHTHTDGQADRQTP